MNEELSLARLECDSLPFALDPSEVARPVSFESKANTTCWAMVFFKQRRTGETQCTIWSFVVD